MSKLEFMRALEGLLLDISMEERQEALQYYEGYFEDAGPGREQIIIAELGSPEKVAACIKADLNNSTQEAQGRGYFTERGYEDEVFREPKYEIIEGSAIQKDGATKGREEHTNNINGSKIAFIILLCVFATPVVIPLISVVFGLFISLFFTVVGILFAFIIVSIVLTVVGVALIVLGIMKLFTIPIIGVYLTGAGLILVGIGLLFTMATILLSKKTVPAIIRAFINFCKLPFKNRSVMA